MISYRVLNIEFYTNKFLNYPLPTSTASQEEALTANTEVQEVQWQQVQQRFPAWGHGRPQRQSSSRHLTSLQHQHIPQVNLDTRHSELMRSLGKALASWTLSAFPPLLSARGNWPRLGLVVRRSFCKPSTSRAPASTESGLIRSSHNLWRSTMQASATF